MERYELSKIDFEMIDDAHRFSGILRIADQSSVVARA